MLEPLRDVLMGKRIILASSSPRRAEILNNIRLKYEIIPSTYEENLNPSDFPNPGHFATVTALNKVKEVSTRLATDPVRPDLIIGADTVVSLDGKIYGKPKDEEEAFKHLQALSGKKHAVFTGVVLKTPDVAKKFFTVTYVYVAALDEETIRAYIATREPMDKAGAYGIQGFGGSIVERIEGDYFSVMGLPLNCLCTHIIQLYK